MSDLPPAEWYTDPEESEDYRYWDGSQWTDHRSPRYEPSSGHRDVNELLRGTWGMLTGNWRTLAAIYAAVVVVLLIGAGMVYVGFPHVFGDTLDVLVEELDSLAPDAEPGDMQEVLEEQWDGLTARLRALDSATLAGGLLLIAFGVLVAVAANTVEFAAFGHFTASRLDRRPLGAAASLRAGLRRLRRVFGVALMLAAMWLAVIMVVSLVSGVLGLASAVLGAVLGVLLFLAVLAGMVGAAPVALLALMTAAVGPATPSLRYARDLMRGAYWATFGRMALTAVLSAVLSIALELVVAALGFLGSPVTFVLSATVSVLPEVLFSIACFTIYHDLGGEHHHPADPAA